MEDIRELKEQVKSLEKRVEALEAVLNGKMAQKPGRKPKLSVAQRDEIIRKHAAGSSYAKLAGEYSVGRTTICNICNGYGKREAEKELIIPATRS